MLDTTDRQAQVDGEAGNGTQNCGLNKAHEAILLWHASERRVRDILSVSSYIEKIFITFLINISHHGEVTRIHRISERPGEEFLPAEHGLDHGVLKADP